MADIWYWRLLHPRRTIWPTRDGWWCLFVVMGLGVAALNTGNNLLYLLVSLLLGLIVVSGVLSEQSMRGLCLTAVDPEELYAGRPAPFGAVIGNRKRWLTSYSITIELLSPGTGTRLLYLPRLEAGDERLITWEDTLPRRGRHRLAGVRITTRFPFGLFLKAGRPMLTSEMIVYPAVNPVSPEMLRQLGEAGHAPATIRVSSTGAAAPRPRPSWFASWRRRRHRIPGSSWLVAGAETRGRWRRVSPRPRPWRATCSAPALASSWSGPASSSGSGGGAGNFAACSRRWPSMILTRLRRPSRKQATATCRWRHCVRSG